MSLIEIATISWVPSVYQALGETMAGIAMRIQVCVCVEQEFCYRRGCIKDKKEPSLCCAPVISQVLWTENKKKNQTFFFEIWFIWWCILSVLEK